MKWQTIGPDMIIAVGLSVALILAIVLNVGSEISTTIAAGLVGYIGKVATSTDFNHDKLVKDISKKVNDKADNNHRLVMDIIDPEGKTNVCKDCPDSPPEFTPRGPKKCDLNKMNTR